MKRVHAAALLWAALALVGTASAQNLPSQFVISGETARKIHDFTTINLATAERIAETCERLAQKEAVAVSIYILEPEYTNRGIHRVSAAARNERSPCGGAEVRGSVQLVVAGSARQHTHPCRAASSVGD
jgi:hypothetical protein